MLGFEPTQSSSISVLPIASTHDGVAVAKRRSPNCLTRLMLTHHSILLPQKPSLRPAVELNHLYALRFVLQVSNLTWYKFQIYIYKSPGRIYTMTGIWSSSNLPTGDHHRELARAVSSSRVTPYGNTLHNTQTAKLYFSVLRAELRLVDPIMYSFRY